MLVTIIGLILCGISKPNPCVSQTSTMSTLGTKDIKTWIKSSFAKGKVPPFSFEYQGKSSASFIRSWNYRAEQLPAKEEGVLLYRYTYESKDAGLRVLCDVEAYIAFDAVKWKLSFQNIGKQNSKTLTAVKAIDVNLQQQSAGSFKLHYADGNHISRADFHPRTKLMDQQENFQISPINGRSSEGAFPFFNIETANQDGLMLVVGWTGTWLAEFQKKDSRSLHVSSGMKRFESYLEPDEAISSPSVCLLFWKGNDRMVGHNKFRRFVLAHQTRKIDGKFASYPLSSGFNYRDPAPCTEYSCLTADYAIAMIKRYSQFKLFPEVYWLDAGWNTGAADYAAGKSWANTVGNWTVDTTRFPQGLKPIADEVHKAGAKFMVWFEPERVIKGTQWAVEHPEWMLDLPDSKEDTYLMFDLGNEEARIWLSKYIAKMIKDNGIDYYRQDFNMFPDLYWEAHDQPGRIGMKEIRHIEGLYAFWDYLLESFPNLLIDNCASGGKRIDLETISRSAALWRSDYYHYDDPDGYQGHTYGLNFFLPMHGTGILQTDRYSFRSSMSSALIYNWKITDKKESIIDMQNCLKEFAAVRPYYYEDYYPLTGTEDMTKNDIWLAYQLHRPADQSGIIVAFRRPDAKEAVIKVKLTGLNPKQTYSIKNFDNDIMLRKSGQELLKGFDLSIPNPKGSLLLQYQP